MNKRPARLTLLEWLVLLLAAWNAIRLGSTITNWQLLADLDSSPGPVYIAASAAIWFVCGLGVLMLLLRRHPQALLAASLLAVTYTTWWWIDRLLLQENGQTNWSFNLVLTGILLLLAAFLIFNRTTRAYINERRQKTEQENG